MLTIKICGLSTPETMRAALDAGADMIGLNFHPLSPRFVDLEKAAALAAFARGRALVVALAVDPTDEALQAILRRVNADMVQLHGTETPERVGEVRRRFRLPVLKAIGVGSEADLAIVRAHLGIADHILLDAKPPKGAAYPGGHGRTFNWTLLAKLGADAPFMLSGGLTSGNVREAVATVRAMGLKLEGVDVSSGVESAPGRKDENKMRDFIAAARGLEGP
jgi:phosphoribosylanthranilate isomerase